VRRFSILIACLAADGVGAVRSEDIAAARACTGITQISARLACYDSAFANNRISVAGSGRSVGAKRID
jgi:hypothetical protein